MDREPQEDSNGVIESFWDGHGVEFKAKYFFDFRIKPGGAGERLWCAALVRHLGA